MVNDLKRKCGDDCGGGGGVAGAGGWEPSHGPRRQVEAEGGEGNHCAAVAGGGDAESAEGEIGEGDCRR